MSPTMAVSMKYEIETDLCFSSYACQMSREKRVGKKNARGGVYRPGSCPDCINSAFCSWNRWPIRSVALRFLSTHRITQFSSVAGRALLVKSLTQESKQF